MRRRLLIVRLLPQILGDGEGINVHVVPPTDFVTSVMQLAMVRPAQGDSEFIAYFARHGFRLRKL